MTVRSQYTDPSLPEIATFRVYEPDVAASTGTEEPVVLPTKVAPAVFDVSDQLNEGLERLLDAE